MAKTSVKRILAVAVGERPHPPILRDVVGSGAVGTLRPYIGGLVEGLRKLKRESGTDYVIDYTADDAQRLKQVVADAVKQTSPDLIFPMSTSALQAAMSVPDSIPIVFPSSSDPVADGAVDSFAVPGKNATGVCAMRSQTAPYCLELFKETVPSLVEVMAFHKPQYDPATRAFASLQSTALRVGVKFIPVPVQSHQDIEARLREISQKAPKGKSEVGMLALPDDLVLSATLQISEISLERGLPTFFPVTDAVKDTLPSVLGGFGISQRACGEAAAEYVEKILWRGAAPKDLPVTRGGRFMWKVSDAVAGALKINIPDRVRRALDR